MTTKANRSKLAELAEKRAKVIEKSKKAYGVGDRVVDSVLLRAAAGLARLIDSKYTLAIVVAVCAGVLWMVFG